MWPHKPGRGGTMTGTLVHGGPSKVLAMQRGAMHSPIRVKVCVRRVVSKPLFHAFSDNVGLVAELRPGRNESCSSGQQPRDLPSQSAQLSPSKLGRPGGVSKSGVPAMKLSFPRAHSTDRKERRRKRSVEFCEGFELEARLHSDGFDPPLGESAERSRRGVLFSVEPVGHPLLRLACGRRAV